MTDAEDTAAVGPLECDKCRGASKVTDTRIGKCAVSRTHRCLKCGATFYTVQVKRRQVVEVALDFAGRILLPAKPRPYVRRDVRARDALGGYK